MSDQYTQTQDGNVNIIIVSEYKVSKRLLLKHFSLSDQHPYYSI